MIFLRKRVVGAAHSRLRGPRFHAERSVGICERIRTLARRSTLASRTPPLLALPELPQNDAADALALAICHAHASPIVVKGGSDLV